jgi:hypothetical protein
MKNSVHSITSLLLGLFFFMALLTGTSCIKEEPVENTDPVIPDPKEIIETSLLGYISDAAGNPASDLNISIVTARPYILHATTNADGYFFIPDFENAGRSVVVLVDSPDSFNSYHLADAQKEEVTNLEIMMVEKEILGNFHSSDEGQFNLPGEVTMVVPGDAFGSYEGEVNVRAHWYDPGNENFYKQKIGGRTAINEKGVEIAVQSLGMLALEITDEAGNPIELEKDMEISFPLPAQFDEKHLEEVSAWYLYEEAATWLHESKVNMENQNLKFRIGSRTFWNFGRAQAETYTLSGRVHYEEEIQPAEGKVMVNLSEDPSVRFTAVINSNGHFSISDIPPGSPLDIKILNSCGGEALDINHQPLTANTDLGNLLISEMDKLTITTDARDCEGQTPDNGFIQMVFDGNHTLIRPIEKGIQNWIFPLCLNWESGEFTVLNNSGIPVKGPVEVELDNSEFTEVDFYSCFDTPVSMDIDFQMYSKSTGEQVDSVYYELNNPDDRLVFEVEVDQEDQITWLRMDCESECIGFEFELHPGFPNDWVTKILNFYCLGFEYELNSEFVQITFSELDYTGGPLDLEVNIIDLTDTDSGEKYDVLLGITLRAN